LNKWLKRIGIGLLVLLIVLQLVPVQQTNPAERGEFRAPGISKPFCAEPATITIPTKLSGRGIRELRRSPSCLQTTSRRAGVS